MRYDFINDESGDLVEVHLYCDPCGMSAGKPDNHPTVIETDYDQHCHVCERLMVRGIEEDWPELEEAMRDFGPDQDWI
jgi:hypothetical protein